MADTSCPLVLIEWEDSAQPVPGWRYLSGLDCGGVVKCASVGWLVKDGDQVKALAPNMGEMGDPDSLQVSGLIRIPARCVTRVVKLREGK